MADRDDLEVAVVTLGPAPRTGARLMLWQAMQEYPGAVFLPLRGAVAHAVVERYAPTLLCATVCGRLGFAEEPEVSIEETFPVCIQCVARLESDRG